MIPKNCFYVPSWENQPSKSSEAKFIHSLRTNGWVVFSKRYLKAVFGYHNFNFSCVPTVITSKLQFSKNHNSGKEQYFLMRFSKSFTAQWDLSDKLNIILGTVALRGPGIPKSIFTYSVFLIEEDVSYQELFSKWKNIVPNLSYCILKLRKYIQFYLRNCKRR